MNRSAHFLVVGCLCALAACLSQNVAQAQQSFYSPYNNYYQAQAALLASNPLAAMQAWNRQAVVNNQALQLYSTRYYGRTVNPVTAPGLFPNYYNSASYYPNYNYPSYSYPTTYPYYQSSGVNPYTASVPVYNPYTATVPGYGANPYTPTGGGIANPYSPSNPYNNSYGSGSVLNGAADGLRAEGQYINSLETARILREQANQYKLETTKKEFELRAYIKANTPTYTAIQEKNQKEILHRIQKNSSPGEIASGMSLNMLLKDLQAFRGKQTSLEPLQVSETVLANLNVTKTKYGMGVLRDNGKVSFPSAVKSRFTGDKQRQDFEKLLQTLVTQANNERVNQDTLTDVRNEIERVMDLLVKKVNDVPRGQYIEGKRFLQELEEATKAIDKGEAPNQRAYQKFIEEGKGGRSVQELVDFMTKNNLQFGPATAADESSYRAVHQAMATVDIAMNGQFNTEN